MAIGYNLLQYDSGKKMKVWLFTVVFLFVVIELVMWVKQFILPLPLHLIAGAFLAIASNYEKAKILLPTVKPLSQEDIETNRT
jgi:hypothetical protein